MYREYVSISIQFLSTKNTWYILLLLEIEEKSLKLVQSVSSGNSKLWENNLLIINLCYYITF